MRRFRLLLPALFASTQLLTCFPAHSAEPGLLILEVGFSSRSDVGWASEFTVMNILTKKYIVHRDPIHRPLVKELEDGIYCVYSIKTSDNTDFEYCGEPYFRVAGGKLNNAGLWKFTLNGTTWSVSSAVQNLSETLAKAKLYDSADTALIEKYSFEGK